MLTSSIPTPSINDMCYGLIAVYNRFKLLDILTCAIVGNPPGFENKSRSRNVALGQFIDGGGGGEMSQPHGLSRPGQQPTFVVPMVTNSNNGIANYRLDTGDNIGEDICHMFFVISSDLNH